MQLRPCTEREMLSRKVFFFSFSFKIIIFQLVLSKFFRIGAKKFAIFPGKCSLKSYFLAKFQSEYYLIFNSHINDIIFFYICFKWIRFDPQSSIYLPFRLIKYLRQFQAALANTVILCKCTNTKTLYEKKNIFDENMEKN